MSSFDNKYLNLCKNLLDRNNVQKVFDVENERKLKTIGKKRESFPILWENNNKKIKRNSVSFKF